MESIPSALCDCGPPRPPHDPPPPLQLSDTDRQALADALCEAFEKSAPVLSQALSHALQAQFERVLGRGVMAWLWHLLIAGLFTFAGYTFKGLDHP